LDVTPTAADFSITQTGITGGALDVTPSAVTLDSTGKIVTLTVPAVVATAADQAVVYSVSYKDGTPKEAPAFTVNKIAAPLISNVNFVSSNANNTQAMIGDTITLTFSSDQPVTKLSNFKINGSNPDTFTNVGNVYTATHIIDSGDIVGDTATFQINVKNSTGIYSQTVENTSDGSSVSIIAQYAKISNVVISSDNSPRRRGEGTTIGANLFM